MKQHTGYTLIEIMLVLVLISVSAVAVIVNLPDRKQDLAKEQAQRFFYRLQLLNESALLNGHDYGIRVEESTAKYTYLVLRQDGWQSVEDKKYPETELEEEISIKLEIGGDVWFARDQFLQQESLFDEEMFSEYETEKQIKPPQLFVLSSGELTPFQLSFSPMDNPRLGWLVDVKESGEIALVAIDNIENQ